MKKPLIVRIAGLVGLLALALFVCFLVVGPSRPNAAGLVIVLPVLLWLAGVSLGLWLLCTVIFAIVRAAARSQAQQFAGIVESAKAGMAPRPAPRRVQTGPLALADVRRGPLPPGAPSVKPSPLISAAPCEVCGRNDLGWLLHCCRHEVSLCARCVAAHDVPVECYYIPAGRAPRASLPPSMAMGGKREG